MSPFREVMELEEKYLVLRSYMHSREMDFKVSFKHEDLEQLWFCTRRNVKRVLNQLEADGYFRYIPGRGRGNYSVLLFNQSFKEEIEAYIKKYVELGNLDMVAFILRLPIPRSWLIQLSSASEFQKLFGFKRHSISKDILYTFKSREVSTLDPVDVSIALEVHLTQQLGDTLVCYDSERNRIIPHLAHHFIVDQSELIYTFYLRKDVHFHNMDKLSSLDVAFTVERLKTKSKAYAWLVESIKKVECETPYKVSIHLKKRNSLFLQMLSTATFCILPSNTPFNEQEWIGTGPFLLKERSKSKIILQAFEHYFKERALIDEVHFYTVSKDAANLLYLQSNPEKSKTKIEEQTLQDLCVVFLLFNQNRNTILKNSLLRTAIYHLMDLPKMIKDLQLNVCEASSFSDMRSKHLEKNQKLISTLLIKANYAGEEMKLGYLDNELTAVEAKWIIEEAGNVGINLKLMPISHTDFYDQTIMNEVDLLFMKMIFSIDRHLSFMSIFRNEHLSIMQFLQTETVEFIKQQLNAFEGAHNFNDREQIIIETERILRDEKHLVFLYHPTITRTIDPIIQNATHHSYGHVDFRKLWLP